MRVGGHPLEWGGETELVRDALQHEGECNTVNGVVSRRFTDGGALRGDALTSGWSLSNLAQSAGRRDRQKCNFSIRSMNPGTIRPFSVCQIFCQSNHS